MAEEWYNAGVAEAVRPGGGLNRRRLTVPNSESLGSANVWPALVLLSAAWACGPACTRETRAADPGAYEVFWRDSMLRVDATLRHNSDVLAHGRNPSRTQVVASARATSQRFGELAAIFRGTRPPSKFVTLHVLTRELLEHQRDGWASFADPLQRGDRALARERLGKVAVGYDQDAVKILEELRRLGVSVPSGMMPDRNGQTAESPWANEI